MVKEEVEGTKESLAADYRGTRFAGLNNIPKPTIRDAINEMVKQVQSTNQQDSRVKLDEVYENGFSPVAAGFKNPDDFEAFSHWTVILPTDQVVAEEFPSP
jgi:hypothetical protein